MKKKCSKCKRNHLLEETCCYNLAYQQWLLEESERVNYAIKSHLEYEHDLRKED